jgi:hypothetical protein
MHTQAQIEQYCSIEDLKASLIADSKEQLTAFALEFEKILETYVSKHYHESKNIRVAKLKEYTAQNLIEAIYSSLVLLENQSTLVSVMGVLAGHFTKSMDEYSAHLCAGELLALANNSMYEIYLDIRGHYYVNSYIDLSEEVKHRVLMSMFIPPMVEKPKKLYRNNDTPYHTIRDSSLILGHKQNYHDGDICLDVINIQNSIMYKLKYKEVDLPKPEGMDEDAWATFKFTRDRTKLFLNHRHFCIPNKVDKRGRLYTRGYVINTQGNEAQKSEIIFYDGDVIKEPTSLKLAIANSFGLDKENRNIRLAWFEENIDRLEDLCQEADEPYLYAAALEAWEEFKYRRSSRIILHQDAVCSGIQHLSCLGKDINGMFVSGLSNNEYRPDAYTYIREVVQEYVGDTVNISRSDCKDAVMTGAYGSRAVPERIFGTLVNYFDEACYTHFNNAFQVRDVLINAWQKDKATYEWTLPDGFNVFIPVITKTTKKLEIDELNHAKISCVIATHGATENGVALAGNFVHSVDAYVLREVVRLANLKVLNYDFTEVSKQPLRERLLAIYNSTGIVSSRWLTIVYLGGLPEKLIEGIKATIALIKDDERFSVVTVHDSFGSHPNYTKLVRKYYNHAMESIANGYLLEAGLEEITGKPVRRIINRQVFKFPIDNYALG